MKKTGVILYLTAIAALLLGITGLYAFSFPTQNRQSQHFDGERALADVETQVGFGARIPGTESHQKNRIWMQAELEKAGWQVQTQQTSLLGNPIHNLIASRDQRPPVLLLGAHYDSRMYADRDPVIGAQALPVPGANDGASGVAVLLELARVLPPDIPPTWLVFFDSEDNGHIEGWDWILGSRAFVQQTPILPQKAVIVDMVGDADLNLYLEGNSDDAMRAEIWQTAQALGYGGQFINEVKYHMLDDHTPFLEAGIPAVDIIDFDYPYFHTTGDTPDKVSAESLKAVGETVLQWVLKTGQ